MDAEPTSLDDWRDARTPGSLGRTPSNDVAALFEREYDPMLRLAYVLVRSQDDAEEIVQEAFLAVQARWTTLLNPGGYLRTTVVNAARQHLRRTERRRQILRQKMAAPPDNAVQPEYLTDALDTLPEQQRTAVVLAYYAGMGATEIAETMGCRVGTAKSWVHRGLKKLRKELDHE